MKNPILLTPGPVPLFPEVRDELSRPMNHHRSEEIQHTLKKLGEKLGQVFHTKEPVYLINSTGTGAMEASLTNTLSKGDEVLSICAGKFGERWRDMAGALGLKSFNIEVPWGQAVSAGAVEAALKAHPSIKAVLMQACETSTGTFHPVKDIAYLTKNKPDRLLIVDAVTALVAQDILMDEWGIDVLIGGSQKSFALPAGLSLISLSKKAQVFQKKSNLPVYYFDLKKEKEAMEKGQTAFSANVSFIRALKAALDFMIQDQNLNQTRKKMEVLSRAARVFCKTLNLKNFSSSPGPSLTAVEMPEGVCGLQVKKWMEEKNVIVGGGQGKLKGRIIRFGHIGHILNEDLAKGLEVFGQALKLQKPEIFTEQKINLALNEAKKVLSAR